MYTIVFKKSAEKDLSFINYKIIKRIINKVENLKNNPFPQNSTKLIGTELTYRLRVGDYRIIYQIDEANKIITIYYIRHRKDVYRKLK
ncbi:MAG: type II toxin-antitoxin system RelE/ParE family toxin [Spirochaetes bacterium]|nr:type II toxin-antitoxin system RelE/ParE family toxin [Spirochaetota bacterium]